MPRWIAELGTSVALAFVSTSMRTLANWLGKSALSALGKSALSFTVPVAGSIWLSAVSSMPVASLTLSARSYASTGSFAAARIFAITGGRLSSGIGKTTLIGCSCVMTTMPLTSPERTMLPGSTWRRPRRPPIGAVTRV